MFGQSGWYQRRVRVGPRAAQGRERSKMLFRLPASSPLLVRSSPPIMALQSTDDSL